MLSPRKTYCCFHCQSQLLCDICPVLYTSISTYCVLSCFLKDFFLILQTVDFLLLIFPVLPIHAYSAEFAEHVFSSMETSLVHLTFLLALTLQELVVDHLSCNIQQTCLLQNEVFFQLTLYEVALLVYSVGRTQNAVTIALM